MNGIKSLLKKYRAAFFIGILLFTVGYLSINQFFPIEKWGRRGSVLYAISELKEKLSEKLSSLNPFKTSVEKIYENLGSIPYRPMPRVESNPQLFYFSDGEKNEFLISDAEKQVLFEENGHLINTIQNCRICDRSPDGKFYLLQELPLSELRDTILVCNYKGEKIWSTPGINAENYSLSPNGEYAISFVNGDSDFIQCPKFFNKNGLFKGSLEPAHTNIYGFQANNWVFSKTGALVAISASKNFESDDVVIIFDDNANIKGSLPQEIRKISGMAFSDDGKKIAVSGLDESGDRMLHVYKVSTPFSIWSSGGAHTAFAWTNNDNILVSTGREEELLSANTESEDTQWEKIIQPCAEFRPHSIRQDGIYTTVLGYNKNINDAWLLLLNKSGNISYQHKFLFSDLRNSDLKGVSVFDDKVVVNGVNSVFVAQIKTADLELSFKELKNFSSGKGINASTSKPPLTPAKAQKFATGEIVSLGNQVGSMVVIGIDATTDFIRAINLKGIEDVSGQYTVPPQDHNPVPGSIFFVPDESSRQKIPFLEGDNRGIFLWRKADGTESEPVENRFGETGRAKFIIEDLKLNMTPNEAGVNTARISVILEM